MILSTKAWDLSAKVIEAIKAHPFNQELITGTLARDKFAYYIEQDTLYLQDFARCHALIASKVAAGYMQQFLRYANNAFIAEQEVVHQFFKKIFTFQATGLLTPATLSYTSYLLQVCTHEPVEMAIAAILPCFWVYQEVSTYTLKLSHHNNPYIRWIQTYASDDFARVVKETIHIFDTYAENTTDILQQKMLEAFYKSTCLEWHFWNDAYHQIAFDDMPINSGLDVNKCTLLTFDES